MYCVLCIPTLSIEEIKTQKASNATYVNMANLMSTSCTELNSTIAIPDEENPSKCSIEMSSIIQHESGFNTIVQ